MWDELIGKKIVAFRGYQGKGRVELAFILFDDKESYLELSEQDAYDYHDCCNSARLLNLHKNAEIWSRMFDKKEGFGEPSQLGYNPF